ncbi:amidase [Aliiroseovarius sp. PTFE2010]|uniref:amidase n=1 Tax=Aliiroseovarius sp. PTFE2010 TaxID=3417190 RepID=UPI003CEF4092
MSERWLNMTMADLGRGIDAGEIDPLALAQSYLDAITAHEMTPRIYARLTEDRAIAEAQGASVRAKYGQRRSHLDGVPLSWKDLFDTQGVATEAGSALLAGRIPSADARVLRQATLAGTVCLGKTHMSELAFSGLGYNPVTQTSPCVHDIDAVAGGSSSGAAASVAFGLAPGAIGSDTGGSVRVPSAWNDLVGLKTSAGLLSLDGVVPLADSFDTVGPLCRSVEDCALALSVLSGAPAPDLRGADLDGMRFAQLNTVAMDDLRPEPAQAYADTVARLRAKGVTITQIDVPEVAEAFPLAGILYTAEAYGIWRDTIEGAPDKMFPEILARFRAGADFGAVELSQAWHKLTDLRRAYHGATAGFDAVIMPSVANMPPAMTRLADSDTYVTENLLALRNPRVGNLMGNCALTIPTGVPSTGIMLNAPPRSEARLLRVGRAVERALA